MSLIRDLTNAVREQMELARQQALPPVRPTSLREAGATGVSDAERARMRQDRAPDQASRTERDNAYPEGAAPNDQEGRSRRRRPVQASSRAPRTDSRATLLTALRSPASLRTAILIKEVLDPPVALRGDSQPPGERGGR